MKNTILQNTPTFLPCLDGTSFLGQESLFISHLLQTIYEINRISASRRGEKVCLLSRREDLEKTDQTNRLTGKERENGNVTRGSCSPPKSIKTNNCGIPPIRKLIITALL